MREHLVLLPLVSLLLTGCTADQVTAADKGSGSSTVSIDHQATAEDRVVKSDDAWREILSAEEFYILREQGTERAFSGDLWNHKGHGTYYCAACGLPLFDSETKFKSGTGWPSFYAPIDPAHVGEHSDRSYGMVRTEVVCTRCGGHLGHVFPDGPRPTGLRYCINSASLNFEPTTPRDRQQ